MVRLFFLSMVSFSKRCSYRLRPVSPSCLFHRGWGNQQYHAMECSLCSGKQLACSLSSVAYMGHSHVIFHVISSWITEIRICTHLFHYVFLIRYIFYHKIIINSFIVQKSKNKYISNILFYIAALMKRLELNITLKIKIISQFQSFSIENAK